MVSVIIPVYNTANYLRGCIKSICDQTFDDLEIIIIDDGSDRFTADMCDQLQLEDDRIIVVHKKNEGVSKARNHGLEIAKGEIICFVDSDDEIDKIMIEVLVDALYNNNAQIAICDAFTKRKGKNDEIDTICDYEKSSIIDVNNISPATLSRLAGSAWRCAYRRTDTLTNPRVTFPVGIKFSEDRIFNIMAMSRANKIAYIKQPLYHRLIRNGSACFRYYSDMTDQISKMRDELLVAVENYWGNNFVVEYEKQIAGQIRAAVTNYTSFDNGESYNNVIRNLKTLVNNNEIRNCLYNANVVDTRSRMILNKQYYRLFIIGRLTNLIHKLCKRGQYHV